METVQDISSIEAAVRYVVAVPVALASALFVYLFIESSLEISYDDWLWVTIGKSIPLNLAQGAMHGIASYVACRIVPKNKHLVFYIFIVASLYGVYRLGCTYFIDVGHWVGALGGSMSILGVILSMLVAYGSLFEVD